MSCHSMLRMALASQNSWMNNHALSGTTTISASGDISGGTITTTIGSISSTSGSKHTHNGTVSRKVGSFQTSACTG